MHSLKALVRNAIPQRLRRGFKRLFYARFKHTIGWEYMPDGWRSQERDADIKGWNVDTVLAAYRAGWPIFEQHLRSTAPLGFWYETQDRATNNLIPHNIHMSYAYALMLASRMRKQISMLDWGGAIGQYYLLSKTLCPDLAIEYHCKEQPVLVEYAQTQFPEAHFYTDESCLNRQYDFVLASSAIQYSQDWRNTLRKLASATKGYLLVTRSPFVQQVPSFVFVQRPYQVGYNTEYLGWCINRGEFLACAADANLHLVREFVIGENPEIEQAPEQNEYRGFLFRAG